MRLEKETKNVRNVFDDLANIHQCISFNEAVYSRSALCMILD